MSDPIRAALERLIARLDETADPDGPVPAWVDSYCAARAALAEQQGEGPSDKELNILWNCSGIADEHGNHTGNIFEFARAVLARWGYQPSPPAEGEVAEFITQLKSYAEYGTPIRLIPFVTDRAAELLQQREAEIKRLKAQQAPVPEEAANPWKDALIDALVCAFLLNEENQSDPRRALHDLISWEVQLARDPLINPPVHPTPVPVSERLPGDQLCWWYEPDEPDGYGGRWTLLRIRGGTGTYTHWLPAHALPLPQGEVE